MSEETCVRCGNVMGDGHCYPCIRPVGKLVQNGLVSPDAQTAATLIADVLKLRDLDVEDPPHGITAEDRKLVRAWELVTAADGGAHATDNVGRDRAERAGRTASDDSRGGGQGYGEAGADSIRPRDAEGASVGVAGGPEDRPARVRDFMGVEGGGVGSAALGTASVPTMSETVQAVYACFQEAQWHPRDGRIIDPAHLDRLRDLLGDRRASAAPDAVVEAARAFTASLDAASDSVVLLAPAVWATLRALRSALDASVDAPRSSNAPADGWCTTCAIAKGVTDLVCRKHGLETGSAPVGMGCAECGRRITSYVQQFRCDCGESYTGPSMPCASDHQENEHDEGSVGGISAGARRDEARTTVDSGGGSQARHSVREVRRDGRSEALDHVPETGGPVVAAAAPKASVDPDLELLSRFIVDHESDLRGRSDGACKQCYPDNTWPGAFVCARHRAREIQAALATADSSGDDRGPK